MKTCSLCKEDKEHTKFFKNKGNKDGYQNYCKPCAKLKRKEWISKEQRRAYGIKYAYGLSKAEYNDLLEEQRHSCAVCCTNEPGGRTNTWHVDHNHTTKAVRGLLCAKCNLLLGHADENVEVLYRAVEYIRKHNE